MGFGDALERLLDGGVVYREGWNGHGMSLAIQHPDERSEITLPYIIIWTASDERAPWTPGQADLLSNDWAEV